MLSRSQLIQNNGLQMLLGGVDNADSVVGLEAANFSDRTVSLERNSSIPMYAPHIRRFPSKAERP